MKNFVFLFNTFLVLAVASGCASISMSQLSAKKYQAREKDCHIEVFANPPADKKFEELCLISARGGQSIFEGKDVDSLLPGMKEKACQAGADAIILKNSKAGGYNFNAPADRAEATAVAIKFVANS